MNLYDRLKMSPMSARSMAASVLGVSAPGAIPPAVPDVQSLFSRGSLARSVVNASTDMDYVLGQSGVGLNGASGAFGTRFGGLGFLSGGQIPVFASYTMSDCALSNFYDTANYSWLKAHGTDGGSSFFVNIDYTPPDGSLKERATKGWTYLKNEADSGNTHARAVFDQLDSSMKVYMAQVSALADAHDDRLGCGHAMARGWSAQQQLWEGFSAIVSLMKQFANAPAGVPPLMVEDGPATGGSNMDAADSRSNVDPLTQSYLTRANRLQQEEDAAAQQLILDKQQEQMQQLLKQQQSAATAGGGLPSWALPVGVLAAAGVAAFVILRKKR
ncbi:MAG: hypothetical protein EPN91_08600 [Salinibacterium sp.]|nr:MAG: hypothetical protein EPN91_08600 [Salinibacterium sp.]